MNGFPYQLQAGHFELFASNVVVQWLKVHEKAAFPILLGNQEGICKESLVPWAQLYGAL